MRGRESLNQLPFTNTNRHEKHRQMHIIHTLLPLSLTHTHTHIERFTVQTLRCLSSQIVFGETKRPYYCERILAAMVGAQLLCTFTPWRVECTQTWLKKTVQQKKKKSADWGSSINLPSMVTRL